MMLLLPLPRWWGPFQTLKSKPRMKNQKFVDFDGNEIKPGDYLFFLGSYFRVEKKKNRLSIWLVCEPGHPYERIEYSQHGNYKKVPFSEVVPEPKIRLA
jgi:hypothetical protein